MINVTMSGNEEMPVSMSGDEELNTSMNETVVIDTRNHDELNHRDYADQHPISAITGLTSALSGKQNLIDDLDDIRSGASAGATAVQPSAISDMATKTWVGSRGYLTSVNWTDVLNKPQTFAPSAHEHTVSDINDFPSIPTKTTDLTNDSGFITNSANDLINYYLKSGTYSKEEVNTLISAVKQFTYELVTVLPTASDSTMNKIYLVPSSQSEQSNVKDEYITLDNGLSAETRYTWEQIGSTTIDLSDYYTKSQTDSAIANHHDSTKQNTITNDNKLPYSLISGTPVIPTVPTKLTGFQDDLGDSPVHTHRQYLTEHQSLSGYATQSWVEGKGYLTEHQSLSGYATETWVGQQGFLTSHQDISGKEDTSNKVTSMTAQSTDTQYPSAKCVYDIVGDIESTLQAIRGVS